ncbi:hypothetical protein RH831_11230 [Halodesulfurarchaeum sp. HSR-GB]|uniref:hypothetical protein n=1 Tax=Halodesulfurarchaeum sp. HSR-GB TaxID=3074077 RepID=UPI002856BEC4|nr:hypothetical protein [Halodesulfurarchaeum sp. HSR-GB]MDR5657747.1 hypothetical protein [Halodesulfurarchaeum sp. HSR-GB]
MGRNRNGQGRYSDRIPAEEILQAFTDREDRARPLTAGDIVDELGIARRTAHNKLNILVEREELETRKVGARGRVWWVPIDVDDSSRERREEPVDRTPSRSDPEPTAETPRDSTPDNRDAPEKIADVVEKVAEGWDDPPDRLEDRKAAARAVLEYAEKHGTVSKQEAKKELYPKYPVKNQNPRTWYRKNVRPVLNEAAEYDKSARGYRIGIEE